jgi:hypothetical protein
MRVISTAGIAMPDCCVLLSCGVVLLLLCTALRVMKQCTAVVLGSYPSYAWLGWLSLHQCVSIDDLTHASAALLQLSVDCCCLPNAAICSGVD